VDDLATVSADVGGGLLHRRGYRKATAKAPIRENLAACILQAAEWHPEEALVDPLCGSGTFAIEAAWMALDRAPGLDRELSVTQWPGFPQRLWKERIHEARSTSPPPASLSLHARDRDAGAIKAAKANAERAGVEALLHFSTEDFGAPFPPLPGPGLVVMNPPYGSRVGANAQLSSLYRRLGQTLQAQFSGWRLACVCPERSLAGRLGNLEELTRFSNGGIKVSLWLGEIP
jgi:putative N6-adenine-specific DNA methylase